MLDEELDMRLKRSPMSPDNLKNLRGSHTQPYAPVQDASYHGNLCKLSHRFINIG